MPRIALCAAAAALAALCAASATAGTASRTARRTVSPPKTFTDETGDSGSASDIQTTAVTNDDAGQYSMDIGFGAQIISNAVIVIFLDTDQNPSTGSANALGADFAIEVDQATTQFFFDKWDGTQFSDAPSDTTVSVRLAGQPTGTHLVVSFNRSEVGNGNGFNFWLLSTDGSVDTGHFDDAPSGSGTYSYTLQNAAPLQLSLLASTQGKAKAGGTWSVLLIAKRSDTGATLGPEGTIACHATGGGKALKVTQKRWVSGSGGTVHVAACTFHVGKKLKHKLLHATVTVSYQGLSVTHNYTTHAN
jgi:hypothetical protein